MRLWPMQNGMIVTSAFGPRGGGYHWGTDMGWVGGSAGRPVYAVQDGVVEYAGVAEGFGRWVTIDHPLEAGGGYSVYGHVIPNVEPGQHVSAGMIIAHIDPDSRTNGGVVPHLHFEVHRHTWAQPGVDRMDPEPWLMNASYAPMPQEVSPMKLIDHAAARVGAQAARDAGYDGAIRYLANSPERGLPNKILTREEADGYKALRMELVSNWQKGKHETADWRRGYEGGVADARAALDHHRTVGGPGYRPIYFSVDEDVNLDTWNRLVLPYLNGAASVLGKQWVGVYGGQRSMWWAKEDGFHWRWQTKGWSRYDDMGRWNGSLPVQWVEGVQIRQERVDQDQINGIGIDVNTTHAEDFGQWSKSPDYEGEKVEEKPVPKPEEKPVPTIQPNPNWRGDPVWLPEVLRAFGLKVWEDPNWKTRGHGDFGQILGVMDHHTAGGGLNDWKIVRDGRSDLPGPLSQLVLEKDGTYRVVAAGTAYHAGGGQYGNIPRNQGNQYTIGIEAVSRGTPPWDWTEAQLDAYKRGVAAILWYLGLDASATMAHREYSSEGKIDPAGIDMNAFRRDVQAYIDAGPVEDDMAWNDDLENYKGIPVDASFMLAWIDKREARNEALLSAILDKLAGEGKAAEVIRKFDSELPEKYRG